MKELISYFHIYAFLGWCLEVAYQQVKRGEFINRGMLAGPYCPIYGFGMVFLILSTRPLGDNFFMVFLASAVLCTLWEFLVGFALDKVFGERWWDYSKEPMNIGGYICLNFSIKWGLAGAIAIKELHGPVERLVGWIPDKVLVLVLIILSINMVIDTIITIGHIRGLNHKVDNLILTHKAMRDISDKMGRRISANTARSSERFQAILENPDFKAKMDKVHGELNKRQRRLLKAYPNLRGSKSELQKKILKAWTKKAGRKE